MQSSQVKYISILPTEFKLDGGAMFGIIPKPLWERKITPDESNRINMSLRVLLIQTKNRNILIDSGIGDYHPEKFQQRHGISEMKSPLENILREKLGLSPEDITDIVPSHLHFDHIGGFLKVVDQKIQPVFPGATCHLHKKHWDYSLSPNLRDQGSFQDHFYRPLIESYIEKKQLHWLLEEEGKILEDSSYELRYKCSHGHTPFHLTPYDKKMVFAGDLVPTSAHIPLVWTMGYDMNPGLITKERDELYQWVCRENLTIIYDHDLEVIGSKVAKNEKNGRYMPVELISQEGEVTSISERLG